MKHAPRVMVGMSGGVDSSVAALRLTQKGFEVIGVFIKVWHPPWLVCNWEQERLDAMRVAAHLDIPFLTCDAEAAYRDAVAQYFIGEYTAGHTPNPDVMCNKHVKFGAFLEFANEYKADFIATGHYARRDDTDSLPTLLRGVDPGKDQSYFLWALSNEQLSRSLFPIGDSHKSQIRAEAIEHQLPTALKKDSQGICFLGHINIREFLAHYTTLIPGQVINEQGEEIGRHEGALIYTLGQRHGFFINTKEATRTPYYVVQKNIKDNTITVSPHKPLTAIAAKIVLRDTILREPINRELPLEAQTRYQQSPFQVKINDPTPNENISLTSQETTDTFAVGQSCVLYQGAKCLGGGIIA